MRLRCGVATAAVLAVVGHAVPARAQYYLDWKGSVTLTGAYARSYTDGPAPTALTYSGPTFSLSPALNGLLDTLRTENTLSYGLSLTLPFTSQLGFQYSGFTYANRLAYSGHYALSELTSMTFTASLAQSPLFSVIPSQDSTSATVQAVPPGVANMITVGAGEGFSRQVSELTAFSQGGAFAFGDPINPTSLSAHTYSASNSFSLTRSFITSSLGATLSNQINYFTAGQGATLGTGPASISPPGSTYVNTLSLNLVHPFSERISGTLVAGVTQTVSPGATTLTAVEPTGSASLSYEFNIAVATLSYAHVAAPNLATASVNFNDVASLRFSLPIGLTGLVSSGSLGFTHSVPILSAATPLAGAIVGPSFDYLADVSLAYTPVLVPVLTLGVRGQLTRQQVPETPADDFLAYTVGLNVTYSYPSATAAMVRPSFSPLYSAVAPTPSDVISTERFFSGGVSGPAPAEPLPLPKGP